MKVKKVLASVIKPNRDSFRNLINNLTIRYVAALFTIALLVSSSPLLILNVLEQQELHRSFIVKASLFSDMSKMLSQLSVSSALYPSAKTSTETYMNIGNQVLAFRRAWVELAREVPKLQLPSKYEREFRESFSKMEDCLKPFLSNVEKQLQIRKEKASAQPSELVRKIVEEEVNLYNATRLCNRVLEASLTYRVEKFRQIEWIFTAIILCVVVLQGLFILRPAVQKVENAIGNLKLSEKMLQKARQEAVEALRIRSEFVTKISHEIRNPLNAILGMSELLLETRLDFGQRRYAEISIRAGLSILDLLNDFLEFSRLESGKVELENIEYNVAETVERAIDFVSSRAEEKRLELNLEFDWNLPATMYGDPKRIQQILVNLLGNAIKFTPSGEVHLQVKRTVFAGKDQLAFIVSDTGIGIPPDRQSRIFESFVQVDSSTSREFGGSGLGLAICRDLVKLMRGTITLKSEMNNGSVFYVYVPFNPATPKSFLSRFHELSKFKIDVGILERNEKVKNRLGDFLSLCGVRVSKIHPEFSTEDLKKYDVLLVDQEFLYSINWLGVEISSVQNIVWLSQLKDLYQVSSLFGNDTRFACIPKPVKLTQVVSVLSELMQKKESPAGLHKPIAEIRASKAKILVLEDSEDNRMVLKLYLKDSSVEVVFGVNGREGLNKFKEESFDIVFVDIEMPEMDGFQATREMRSFEKQNGRKPTPIIALTAYGHKEEIQKCFDAGCSQHLTKPIRKNVFLNVIQETMKEKSDRLLNLIKIDG